ncbi:MAG: hypothetical protein P8X69_07295, partial [Maritimibacter sp.]
MMIDHIVAHFDTAREISDLKASLDAAGIPFEPSWGKKAKGFEISNIWIGEQYFELVQIKDDNNLWQPEWATRHRAGDRGAYCLFLDVDEEIETLRARLIGAGIAAGEVQRTSFKWFFNLFEKRLPWRFEEHIPKDRRKIDRISLFKAKPGLKLRADNTFNDEEY